MHIGCAIFIWENWDFNGLPSQTRPFYSIMLLTPVLSRTCTVHTSDPYHLHAHTYIQCFIQYHSLVRQIIQTLRKNRSARVHARRAPWPGSTFRPCMCSTHTALALYKGKPRLPYAYCTQQCRPNVLTWQHVPRVLYIIYLTQIPFSFGKLVSGCLLILA